MVIICVSTWDSSTFTSLITEYLPFKDSGDGKGTAKGLLDIIAEKESEAQKSFMHRSVFYQELGNIKSHWFTLLIPHYAILPLFVPIVLGL